MPSTAPSGDPHTLCVTAKEFREMVPLKERTYFKLMKAGKLPPHKRFGKLVLFARADIAAWLGKPAA